MHRDSHTSPNDTQSGFTIVELTVVIFILGILSLLVYVGWGAWRQNVADVQVKNDLNNVTSFLENERRQSGTNEYPATIPVSFPGTEGVILSGGAINSGASYCVEGTAENYPSIIYYVSPESLKPSAGPCPPPEDPMNPTLAITDWTLDELETYCATSANAPSGYNVIDFGSGFGNANGTAGNDIIYRTGGFGNVYGNGGNDVLCVGNTTGSIYGGDGTDLILITSGTGTAYGEADNDTLVSTGSLGSLRGGDNDDTFYTQGGAGQVDGGAGYDRATTHDGSTHSNYVDIEEVF